MQTTLQETSPTANLDHWQQRTTIRTFIEEFYRDMLRCQYLYCFYTSNLSGINIINVKLMLFLIVPLPSFHPFSSCMILSHHFIISSTLILYIYPPTFVFLPLYCSHPLISSLILYDSLFLFHHVSSSLSSLLLSFFLIDTQQPLQSLVFWFPFTPCLQSLLQ